MDTQFLDHPYALLFNALSLIPLSHYFLLFSILFLTFLYNFFDFHFFRDLFFGLRGTPVTLHCHPSSPLFNHVLSHCQIFRRRYLATPWLSSPHLQTFFLHFFGNPPSFTYTRELFHTSDGGTIALDWLLKSDVLKSSFQVNNSISEDDATPIVLVVPGLTSDSASTYLKHLAFNTAKNGWNVVVSNHRGLGGVSVTSDCFYNAGWTDDIRAVAHYLQHKYPKASLFAVGTSIGANVLVKYLGEDKELTPIAGAAAICNPWDLVIGDRFICRRLVQRFYDRALTIGLQGYAQLHEPRYSRLANWEGIKRSRSIRDFDHHATCHVGKFETVDTYYRRCSSSYFVGNVSVPLLCISALDDPLCTREAIPWDECRANKNIVLATTQHGGHLAFFEGLFGSSLWWVRAVNEFLGALQSSSLMHVQKTSNSPAESTIDHGPYVRVTEDGMVAAAGTEQTNDVLPKHYNENGVEMFPDNQGKNVRDAKCDLMSRIVQTSEQDTDIRKGKSSDANAEVRRSLNQIYRQSSRSIWVLALIAVVTSWPILGSALNVVFRKKRKNII